MTPRRSTILATASAIVVAISLSVAKAQEQQPFAPERFAPDMKRLKEQEESTQRFQAWAKWFFQGSGRWLCFAAFTLLVAIFRSLPGGRSNS